MLHELKGPIEPQSGGEPDDLFLAAASFEARCANAAQRLAPGSISHAISFRYLDTLDTILGAANSRGLLSALRKGAANPVAELATSFADPYGAVRQLNSWFADVGSRVRSVTIDISCFTKLHLILLLEYLRNRCGDELQSRFVYTEPLTYATSFRKPLSYEVRETICLPLSEASGGQAPTGLIVFLAREIARVERVVDDLEPDVTVFLRDESALRYRHGLAKDTRLLERLRYSPRFKLMETQGRSVAQVTSTLLSAIRHLMASGVRAFYVAPLGSKFHALAIDVARSFLDRQIPLVLAYAMPKRYERYQYSQGVGKLYEVDPDVSAVRDLPVLEVDGVMYLDPCRIPVGLGTEDAYRARKLAASYYQAELADAFGDSEVEEVGLSDGHVTVCRRKQGSLGRGWMRRRSRETGRMTFLLRREDMADERQGGIPPPH